MKAKSFHESFKEYSNKPLVDLNNLAKTIGVNGIYLKNEFCRFGKCF